MEIKTTKTTKQIIGQRDGKSEKLRGKKEKISKIATWNIRSIQGKEDELEAEFESMELELLAITETKKKGEGSTTTKNGHLLIYSGVKNNMRAKAGVGCLINKRIAESVYRWKSWSERILSVELKDLNNEVKTIIVVYGPNEDNSTETKEQFWDELTTITEEAIGTVVILGDFNGRVGRRDSMYKEVMGPFGEDIRNNNGERLLNFCILNNMLVTNTLFEHKNIHRYTREMSSRGEKSIIDYILVQKEKRAIVLDTKVRRGPEIGSDHYVVTAKIKDENNTSKNEEKTKRKIEHECLRTHRLADKDIAKLYKMETDKRFEEVYNKREDITIELLWKRFKDIVIESTRKICGSYRKANTKKQTAWWTEEIKAQVKIKKEKWKKYINQRTTDNYEQYKKERKAVKDLVMSLKKKKWREFGEKMETDYKTNQKLFYRVLKTQRNGKQKENTTIKDRNGGLLKGDNEVMERWREYFRELLDDGHRGMEESYDRADNIEVNEDTIITMEELKQAIKTLKNGKAPGCDMITSEMIKNLGENGMNTLLHIFEKVWNEEVVPEDWRTSLIVPVYKTGDKQDCSNYRGITLLSTAMKLYEKILDRKIRQKIEATLEETQSGFRKGRSIQDHIFTMKILFEKAKQENRKLYIGYIDLVKAFDKVERKKLWKILEKRGISRKLIQIIKNIYSFNKNRVISHNRSSKTFNIKTGLRQGGSLSPVLFAIFMDEILKECTKRTKKFHVGYRNMQRVEISECAFVDDVIVIAGREKDLQGSMEIWNEVIKEFGMEVNKIKTKVMVVGEPEDINIELDGIKMEQVKSYRYLGVELNEDGGQNLEINRRIENTMKLYHMLNKGFISKKEISRNTKISVYKSIYRPTLTFSCESWALTGNQKKKIQAVEMKYLRRVRGVTRMHKLRNETIRQDLDIEPIQNFIERRQLSWWGHLNRMNNERPAKRIWETKIQKRKKRGRPEKTWNNILTEIINGKGKTWSEARRLAMDKRQWTEFVHGNAIF